MSEEREYIRRAAAPLDSIMKKPFEPTGHDRRLISKSKRRKMTAAEQDKKPEKLDAKSSGRLERRQPSDNTSKHATDRDGTRKPG